MDIVEYVEKVCVVELLTCQKEMLRTFSKIPEDAVIVMGLRGPIILDKNGKKIDLTKGE